MNAMKTSRFLRPALAAITALAPALLCAQTATLSSVDRIIGEQQSGGPGLGYVVDVGNATGGISGANGSRTDTNVVLGFTLPTLPEGETVKTAVVSFEISEAYDQVFVGLPNLHAYLLNTANPDGSGTTYFYHGLENDTEDTRFVGATRVDLGGVNQVTFEDDAEDRSFVLSGDALALLQSFYGGDHIPDQAEAFFRFNLDVNPEETSFVRYVIDSASDESSVEINASVITYVDAVAGASGNTGITGEPLSDITWVGPDASSTNNTQWNERTGLGTDGTIFQALPNGDPSGIPELTTKISGLADGTYDVWVFFHDNVGDTSSPYQNWVVSAGLTSGSLTTYWGPGQPQLHMDNPPNGGVDVTTDGVSNAADLLFVGTAPVIAEETGTSERNLFGVNLGPATVTGGSDIEVFIGMNIDGKPDTSRAWYDGVGYAPAAASAGPSLAITSFIVVGGGVWEASLSGDPATTFEFRSSTTLDFTPGTLVENLTKGDPGDPGTIGGPNNSQVTTDGSGNATVRMPLSGNPKDFVRAQTAP